MLICAQASIMSPALSSSASRTCCSTEPEAEKSTAVDVQSYSPPEVRLAPDGGWGYLVLLGLVLCFISTFGEMSCLGLMFGDFLTSLGLHTGALTSLPSCYYMSSSIVGAFANFLFGRYAVRTVGLFGAVSFVVGSLATVGVGSLNELLLAYGLLQGVGFGIMLAVSYTTFNRYFVRRRVPMMGLAQTLLGLGNMALPIAIEWWHELYGFRGCMLMVAGLNVHVVLGMLMMHPVEWHTIRGRKPSGLVADAGETEMLDPRMSPKPDSGQLVTTTVLDGSRPSMTVWSRVVRFLDLELCRDAVYVNIAVGMALVLYSDVAYFTILPVYLRELGIEKMATAQAISLCAAADLLARFVLTVGSYAFRVRARTIFLAGVLGTIATRLIFQHVSNIGGNTMTITMAATAIGFFRAWIHVPIAIVFADHLPAERFPSGYGLFMVIQGGVMFVLGPVIGQVRDFTGSYAVTFNFLTVVLAACAVPWSVEMYADRWRLKRNEVS